MKITSIVVLSVLENSRFEVLFYILSYLLSFTGTFKLFLTSFACCNSKVNRIVSKGSSKHGMIFEIEPFISMNTFPTTPS